MEIRDVTRSLAITPLAGSDAKRFLVKIDDREYSVIVTRDDIATDARVPDLRWHVSVAGDVDVPAWAHLAAIGHRLRPGVVFVLGVPPKSWWINIHEHCLHLWETKDEFLIDCWRSERRGDGPS